MKSRSISVSIAVPSREVYDFASNPENLPQWAPGFCRSAERSGGEWIIQSPDGPAVIRFAEQNPHGVLDHVVKLASGAEVYSPMRVIPNGAGSEVVFTLFRAPGMSDEQYAEDARLIESDLGTLKRVLEGRHGT